MFLHESVLLPMIIVIPKESTADERRVAIAPDNVAAFTKLGYEVHVEAGAGVSAEMPDELYKKEGASIIEGKETIWQSGDLILKVNPPTFEEAKMIRARSNIDLFRISCKK